MEHKATNAHPLDSMINLNSREAGHGLSKNGTFYFTSNRDDKNQCCGDVFHTQFLESGNPQIQKSNILSSEADEESLYLSPDQRYIIIQAWKGEYESKHDLYISYRTKEGTWTALRRLHSNINSVEIEQRPFVSADHKALFFSRMSITNENGQDLYDSDIYWVGTQSVFSPFVYNGEIESSLTYGEEFAIKLPNDLFRDIDSSQLSYQMTLHDDSEIPEWIEYDPERLTLSGIWNTRENLNLKCFATDIYGNSGAFNFELEEKD